MAAEITRQYEGPENRSLGRRKGIYNSEQSLALIAKQRFGETRPADLKYPATKFAEDGKEGETVDTAGADLRRDLTSFFDRLEGKVDTAKLEALKASFLVLPHGRQLDFFQMKESLAVIVNLILTKITNH